LCGHSICYLVASARRESDLLLSNLKETDKHRRRRVLLAVASIIALFALLVVVDSVLYYGKIHTGVSIAGRSVGGMTHDEATALLNRMAVDDADSAVTLSSGLKTWT